MDRLLTVEDAMRFFGFSDKTIYKMCLTGKLDFVKFGKTYRFRPQWFDEAIERLKE